MALPRGLIYLCLATAAASSRHNKKNSHTHIAPHKYGDDAVGAYANMWAAPNTNRSVAHFFEHFGAIDVGCTYDVERSGAQHTILELAAEAGCINYNGELWRDHSYEAVRHMKPSKAGAELQLTCDIIHEKCPSFQYGNEGPGQPCVFDEVPDALDNVLHHAIPPDGQGLRTVPYGSQKLVVENTCFYAGNRARIDDARDVKRNLYKYAGSWREYLEKLGVVGRDVKAHPWGE